MPHQVLLRRHGCLRLVEPNPAPQPDEDLDDLNGLKYRIVDGGHTFEVIQQTVKRATELQNIPGWTEPFVRVHFLAGDADALASGEIEQVVEALNTSSPVQQFTIDVYQNKFEALKAALATGYFEIGALLSLEGQWQKLDHIRILMGDEVSKRTKRALLAGIQEIKKKLDDSIENEKEKNDFLAGVPAVVEALQRRQIECRVYTKEKFHAKAFITLHARSVYTCALSFLFALAAFLASLAKR